MSLTWHRPAWLAALLICLFGWVASVQAEPPLPASPSPSYVRDDAGWLSASARRALDEKLEAYERETSSQFVVAIFPEIPEGAELFDFSQRLYQKWQVGQAGKDNGAILVIFANDRKLRIHTGKGMEGAMPDARCIQIISNVIAPELRKGDREGAVEAGVDAMIAAAKGEYVGDGSTRLDGQGGSGNGWIVLLVMLFVLYVIFRSGSSQGRGGMNGADILISVLGSTRSSGGWGGGGGFSGGGGSSGGGGASGSW
jgi:uncharacterized protein